MGTYNQTNSTHYTIHVQCVILPIKNTGRLPVQRLMIQTLLNIAFLIFIIGLQVVYLFSIATAHDIARENSKRLDEIEQHLGLTKDKQHARLRKALNRRTMRK